MKTRVFKSGNSLATRIPASFAMDLGMKAGSFVNISQSPLGIRIRPIKKKKYQLKDLLSGIKKSNLHSELGPNSAIGAEAID